MKTPSITRAAALLCLWPMVAASAFARSGGSTTSTATTAAIRHYDRGHHHRYHHRQHQQQRLHTTSGTQLHLSIPRGGGGALSSFAATTTSKLSALTSTPTGTFNLALSVLAASTAILKLSAKNGNRTDGSDDKSTEKDPKVKSLQLRFLAVFWLLRTADWLQGPYFYQVYASKSFGGGSASASAMTWVSRLFLTGFASTAIFGPLVGRLIDSNGRKAGTLAFSVLYALGATSTKSNVLGVLLLGRVLGGIGTSLLFSAPEAWLVGEAGKEGVEGSLGETFGLVSCSLCFVHCLCCCCVDHEVIRVRDVTQYKTPRACL